MCICPLAIKSSAMQCWWLLSTVQGRSLCAPRFQVGFGHSFLGTHCNRTTISRGHKTGSTLSAVSIDGHRFSAFWLRSRMGLSSESFENFLCFASWIAGFFLLSELLVFSPSYLDCFGVQNMLFFVFPDILGVAS